MDFDEQSPIGSGKFTTTSGIAYERVYVKDIDMASTRHARIQVKMKERFGINLRSFQVGAIADILDRDKDVFVIAGTSAGKSMVYQGLSVMEKEFITLVITPTIALMTDQVNPCNLHEAQLAHHHNANRDLPVFARLRRCEKMELLRLLLQRIRFGISLAFGATLRPESTLSS